MTGVPIASDRSADSSPAETRTPWVYPVVLLTIIYALNFVDRQVVNILAEPIKRELGLHDWQLGVLTGLAFSVVYGLCALPIARFADRTHRPRLIAAAMLLWSGATAVCGLTATFGQMVTARLAVGVGESAFAPAAYSLMTDIVPVRRRTLAFGIFNTGLAIGSMVSMAVGGVVADIWGWRAAFFMVGAPGVVMALLVLTTVAEPRLARVASAPTAFKRELAHLLQKRTFLPLVLAGGFSAMGGYGMYAFAASFFFRVHGHELAGLAAVVNGAFGTHLGPAAVLGPVLGIILGLAGMVGAVSGGAVTDALVRRDVRYYGWLPAAGLVLAVPLLAGGLFWPNLAGAFAFVAIYSVFSQLSGAPFAACVQGLASPAGRATAAAISLLAIVAGNGLGPMVVGVTSDLVAISGLSAGAALRLALIIGSAPLLVAAILYFVATRRMQLDLGQPTTLAAAPLGGRV